MPQTAKTATMKKLLLLLAALFAISAGGICCSGSGDDPGEQEKPVDPPPSPDDGVDWSKIDPKATVRGVVTCAGAAVQGVVVTDGVNMTRTNKQGAYGLRTSSDKSKLVYLTVPSGYEVESTRGFIPRFYRRVTAPTSVEQVQRHDFTLKKVNNDRHIMIVSADMHIRNRAMIKTTSSATPSICPPKGELDSTTFRRTYLKTLRDYVKALPAGVPVYGMNLGDMTQESHWTNANKATLANFVNVCERGGMPIQTFHAIGNHDHDRNKYTDREATENYRNHFGPTYYAFDMGRTHYIVLDDIVYHGAKKYDEQIDSLQLAWAAEYARRLPAGSRVCVAMHAPAMKAWKGNQVMESAARLMDAFAGHELHFITGHTHVNSNYDIREGVVEHNVAQICGNLWYDPINKDGTPKGYQLFRECGGEFSWEYRSLGSPAVRQLRVWQPGQVEAFPGSVVAKIWNWDPCWTVVWYEDGRYRGAMQRIQIIDPDYAAHLDSLKNAGRKLAKSQHPRISDFYFKARPSASAQTIEVVATDRFGRRYSERITLEKAQ